MWHHDQPMVASLPQLLRSSALPYDADSWDRVTWLVTNMPAIEAEVRVESTPENRADRATLETSPAREGAICERTPIWVPREPKLPKPGNVSHTGRHVHLPTEGPNVPQSA